MKFFGRKLHTLATSMAFVAYASIMPAPAHSQAQDAQGASPTSSYDGLAQEPAAQDKLPFMPLINSGKEFLPIHDFTVHIRVINKRMDKIYDYTLKGAEPVTHEVMRITARNCLENHGNRQDNNVAFIEIANPEGYEMFSGWMYQRMPSVSAMDDPVYDVHLMDCKVHK